MPMRFSAVRGVVFDFDGVFTDNSVIVAQDGTESVICSRSDGLGLAKIRALAIPSVVISTEVNPVVSKRCEKLKLPAQQGIDDKAATVRAWAQAEGISLSQVAYLGNDINDLPALRIVGFPCVVADAWPEARALATFVTNRAGGKGAVRELCDAISAAHEATGATSANGETEAT